MPCFICLESNSPLIATCPPKGCHNLKVHPKCLRQLIAIGTTDCAICGFHYLGPMGPPRADSSALTDIENVVIERPRGREIDGNLNGNSCLIPVHICMFMTIPLTFALGVGVLYVIWMFREQMEAAVALGVCVGFVFVVAISVQCQLIYTVGHN